MATQKLKIGLLGCGTVGGGLVELIHKNSALIRQRCGIELSITRILVRDPVKERPGVDRALITTHPEKVINNGCDLVVELVGGIDPARKFIQRSLAGNKHVVTANKALLALDGYSLMKAAEIQKVRLGFEASVCGGIPIVRALRNGLVGNRIQGLAGILNGTCNYILTRMTEEDIDFNAALAGAQENGFAEADPALDIDGHDAAQKLKILAELAFNSRIDTANVKTDGIRHLTSADVRAARESGYVIKHVASAQVSGDSVAMRVAPVLLPNSHPLAGVREENNAVVVRGDAVGEMMFSGKGAGSLPSASAVLSDIVDIACHRTTTDTAPQGNLAAIQSNEAAARYLRFPVSNPSAIGPITTILERNGIAITSAAAVWGKNGSDAHQVRMLTNSCPDAVLETALGEVTRQAIGIAPAVSLSICA